jgi:glycosyltransferase involved in cell wall biosynthesis
MKIAVYTIAKNEEDFVERWHKTAKSADYLLIADTGSTDGTVEKAKALGINVINITINPWRFDDARNAALAALPADIDYCVSLDMDEMLMPVDTWRDDIEGHDELLLKYRNVHSWLDANQTKPGIVAYAEKIHKRNGVRWVGMVHELPHASRGTEKTYGKLDKLIIKHHPDDGKSRAQYDELIKDMYEENPYAERSLAYMIELLISNGEYEKALDYLDEYTKHIEPDNYEGLSEHFRNISICHRGNDKELEYLLKALQVTPDRREVLVSIAAYYFTNKMYAEAIEYADKALAIVDRPMTWAFGEYAWSKLPENIRNISKHNLDHPDDILEFNVDDFIYAVALVDIDG